MAWTTISTIRGDVTRDLTIEVKESNASAYGLLSYGLLLCQEDDDKVFISRRQMGKLHLILEQQLYKIERGL